ncbi:hypothetical protein M8J77_005718 [Diaphorina citri]|nr:hypothetical protein M8J77_005718 [Diaphorina citri]
MGKAFDVRLHSGQDCNNGGVFVLKLERGEGDSKKRPLAPNHGYAYTNRAEKIALCWKLNTGPLEDKPLSLDQVGVHIGESTIEPHLVPTQKRKY